MKIKLKSIWQHKDGGLYQVLKTDRAVLNEKFKTEIIWYYKLNEDSENVIYDGENIFLRTKEHFLTSFKEVK